MPIDKLEKSGEITEIGGNKYICCHKCGETIVTLYRLKDKSGKKIKPAKYICSYCKK